MTDHFFKLVETTYAILLPIVLAWISHHVGDIKQAKDANLKAFEKFQTDMDNIQTDLKGLNKKIEYNYFSNSRYRIIRAADEVTQGQNISDDYLEQLGDDIEVYKTYCEEHPEFRNHKGKKSMDLLTQLEEERQKEAIENVQE